MDGLLVICQIVGAYYIVFKGIPLLLIEIMEALNRMLTEKCAALEAEQKEQHTPHATADADINDDNASVPQKY